MAFTILLCVLQQKFCWNNTAKINTFIFSVELYIEFT
jgi:hypothetical protein